MINLLFRFLRYLPGSVDLVFGRTTPVDPEEPGPGTARRRVLIIN